MGAETLLKQIAEDVATLKEQIVRIEIVVNEIDEDIHREVKPDYVKKLSTLRKQKGIRFKGMKNFDDYFSQ